MEWIVEDMENEVESLGEHCQKECDRVSHPSHYNRFEIEPIDYILANSLPFCEGNIVKYISRHSFKGGKEDILKVIQYCLFILKDNYKVTEDELNEIVKRWKI